VESSGHIAVGQLLWVSWLVDAVLCGLLAVGWQEWVSWLMVEGVLFKSGLSVVVVG
jgi:hypothetical protein